MEDEREGGRDREVEGRYGAIYEQRMNPFAEVRRGYLCGEKGSFMW